MKLIPYLCLLTLPLKHIAPELDDQNIAPELMLNERRPRDTHLGSLIAAVNSL